jgi:sensor histidine kinase
MIKKAKKYSNRISVMFSLLTILTLTLTLLVSAALVYLLAKTGILTNRNRTVVLLLIAAVSVIIGTLLSKLAGRKPIAAIVSISDATKEIAKGNFEVCLSEKVPAKELQDMAHNFNLMAKELAGTELLRNDFVENVSHEFKTPLSAIEGYVMLLQKPGLSDEKRAKYTKKILYNTKCLSSLTGSILLLSQLENQELGIEKESFCLDEQLREVILSQEESWSGKELDLEIDLDSADYTGNKDLLAHVWQNILGNAVKFTSAGGMIHILLRRQKDKIDVSIADNGPGMSEEVKRRVFEKFYQGDNSRSAQGSGLGLALAKRIVDLHGGEIAVSTKEGKGTTFTVILPTLPEREE